MASEQTPVEVPKEVGPEQTPEQTPPETAPTDTAPPPTEAPTTEAPTTTDPDTPTKPSAKEKITGIIHTTGDKIKSSIGGVKAKVTPSSKP